MAVTTVVFDVGETLVDEAATYARWEAEGRTEGIPFTDQDLHADVLACLAGLRERGLRLGAAGNMRAEHEDFLRDVVGFERMLQEADIRLVKLWLDITKEEQAERLEERRTDPVKALKTKKK